MFNSGESDPLDPKSLLIGDTDGKCEEKFMNWISKSKNKTVRLFMLLYCVSNILLFVMVTF